MTANVYVKWCWAKIKKVPPYQRNHSVTNLIFFPTFNLAILTNVSQVVDSIAIQGRQLWYQTYGLAYSFPSLSFFFLDRGTHIVYLSCTGLSLWSCSRWNVKSLQFSKFQCTQFGFPLNNSCKFALCRQYVLSSSVASSGKKLPLNNPMVWSCWIHWQPLTSV